MHVERNVAASLIATLLHCGNSKDGLKARKDLESLGIRKDLHPKAQGKRTLLPPAPWSLSKSEKHIFCKRLYDFKGPDGYCADNPGRSNPKEDTLTQILGPDNPGRLRAMGRGMSVSKLAFFEVKNKYVTEMQQTQIHLMQKVNELQSELAKVKNQVSYISKNT